MKGVWLEDLTWLEARQRFDAGALVVVPVGAAAKAHGSHLPLKTDALTARALAQRLLERLPVVAAPVLTLGFYPAFEKFAGSQSLSAETFGAVLDDVLGTFAAQGVTRMAVLNTGVSTEKPIDAARDDIDAGNGVEGLFMPPDPEGKCVPHPFHSFRSVLEIEMYDASPP